MTRYAKAMAYTPFALLCATAACLPLLAGSATAQADTDRENWGEWRAMGSGFMARRKELPQQPADQRDKASRQKQAGNQYQAVNQRLHYAKKADDASGSESALTEVTTLPLAPVKTLWLRTGEEGVYSMSIAEAASLLGSSEKALRKRAEKGKLSLINAGQATSWYYDESSDQLLFAASPYNTFFSSENAYKFTRWAGKKSQPMTVVKGKTPRAIGQSLPFRESLTFEEEPSGYYSIWTIKNNPDADYWWWDYLQGGYRDEINIPLEIPNPSIYGEAEIRITINGFTDLEPGNEHEVYAELNGNPIGNPIIWDAFDTAVISASFDQSLLNEDGTNTLTLRNRYASGSHPGQWLDNVELQYDRQPIAVNDKLWLHGVASGTQSVAGFQNDDLLVIEAPAGKSRLRRDVLVEDDGNGGYQVSFDNSAPADYLIVANTAQGIRGAALEKDYKSSLRSKSNAADYLIIASQAHFPQTAAAMQELRAARFGTVKVAWLEDIRDEFAAGRNDPFAVTRFMNRVNRHWQQKPQMVLLVGKGTLDELDRMGQSDSLLPIVMTTTPWGLTASDERLLGGTGTLPFAYGRLPAVNDAEGLQYVEKLRHFELAMDASSRRHAVLAADNPDGAGDFHANTEALKTQLLDNYAFDTVQTVKQGVNPVRQTLVNSATWDAGLVSYDGHGGVTQIGNGAEKYLQAGDASVLSNGNYPVFAALTCAVGDFSRPGFRSLSTALVMNPNGGAIAALAPTGLSLDADAQLLNKAFVEAMAIDGQNIGDALANAKQQTNGNINAFMQNMYTVIGDPAVYMR
jgi:Peptidase family C25